MGQDGIDFDALSKQVVVKLAQVKEHLDSALSDEARGQLDGPIQYVLDERYERHATEFSLDVAHRWLLAAVLELGWREDTLGRTDREKQRPFLGRTAHKAERIGKKYQWIALHRFLAAVSDNFVYCGGFHNDRDDLEARYTGPWHVNARDLDPSCLTRRTLAVRYEAHRAWWSPLEVELGGDPKDLPDLRALLEVTDPDGTRWLALDGIHRWQDSPVPGLQGTPVEQRRLYYWIRAYLVKAEHFEATFNWAREQGFGRWMPEVGEQTPQLMLRERGWSQAWRDHNNYYHGYPGWSDNQDHGQPHPIRPTWDLYMAEDATHDCSIEQHFNLHLLDAELAGLLRLDQGSRDGEFVDPKGKLAAFDPSIRSKGPGALLLRKDLYAQLRNQGYELLWTMFGELTSAEEVDGVARNILDLVDVSAAFVRRNDAWEGTALGFERRDEPTTTIDQDPTFRLTYAPTADNPKLEMKASAKKSTKKAGAKKQTNKAGKKQTKSSSIE